VGETGGEPFLQKAGVRLFGAFPKDGSIESVTCASERDLEGKLCAATTG